MSENEIIEEIKRMIQQVESDDNCICGGKIIGRREKRMCEDCGRDYYWKGTLDYFYEDVKKLLEENNDE